MGVDTAVCSVRTVWTRLFGALDTLRGAKKMFMRNFVSYSFSLQGERRRSGPPGWIGRPSRWRRLSMSSQRCGAARSDFFYDVCFYVVCGTACRTHFKVWTQLFAPSRDTPRAPCLPRTDKILLVGVLVVGRLETPLEARTPHAARNAIAPQLDLGKLDGAGYAEI